MTGTGSAASPARASATARAAPRNTSPPAAALVGFAALGAGAAIHVVRVRFPESGAAALHVAYAALHPLALGVGVACALAIGARACRGRSRGARVGLALLASALLSASLIPDDLMSFTVKTAPSAYRAAAALGGLAAAGLVPLAWALGALLRRPGLRWLGPLAALGVGLIEPHVLNGLYLGARLYGVFVAGVFAASALVGAAPPFLPARARPRALGIAALVAALASVLIPPPMGVRSALARAGGVLLPVLPWPAAEATAIAPASRWWRPAAERHAAPPSSLERPVDAPIVILVTIDCMRADVIERPELRRRLPTLASLAERGARFTEARAPGSLTTATLTSIFSGTLFSQQRWEDYAAGYGGKWPHRDRHVRFPRLLTNAGVRTVNIAGTDWLVGRYGIVRGFEEDVYRPGRAGAGRRETRWVHAPDIVERMIEQLGALEPDAPAFLYGHALDAHAPYTSGGRRATPFESYVAELEVVDRALGRLEEHLATAGLAGRTYLIVTADHGEAFGEHGRRAHGNSLYEELIHVPLIVAGPGVRPATIEQLVSLTDLGPTILDLFGLRTPPQFVGESLYPLLRGQEVELTRPILAESILMRSYVRPDGIKVIRDLRRRTLEVYDLEADPDEEHDRVDAMTEAMQEAVSELDAFYAVHQLRKDGYEPPFRP